MVVVNVGRFGLVEWVAGTEGSEELGGRNKMMRGGRPDSPGASL